MSQTVSFNLRYMTVHRSKYFEGMKAGMLAIWPRLSCQYSENTLMDLPSSVVWTGLHMGHLDNLLYPLDFLPDQQGGNWMYHSWYYLRPYCHNICCSKNVVCKTQSARSMSVIHKILREIDSEKPEKKMNNRTTISE